jgi:hypothetical protein
MIKQAKLIKGILASFIIILVIVDVILASGSLKEYPTYSKLFFQNKCKLLWFVFAAGCLVGKIFYNRPTESMKRELTGILVLAIFILLFWAIGHFNLLQVGDSNAVYLCILLFGVLAAHQLWPQYKGNAVG